MNAPVRIERFDVEANVWISMVPCSDTESGLDVYEAVCRVLPKDAPVRLMAYDRVRAERLSRSR